jgi:ubiquitin-protein ligase
MHESPRLRRLHSDLAALERLRDESSVLRFRASGKPAHHYTIELKGKSLARVRNRISVVETHQVEIKLGASYPRTMPELRWLTPIYHPNISEIGMVCLGGYGTHWVPSLNLDELCGMLWDMARYHNYDVRSPYNRDAALWVAHQSTFAFPLDPRPLRDLRAALGRIESPPHRAEAQPKANGVPASETKVSRFADFLRGFRPDRAEESPPIPIVPESIPEISEAPVEPALESTGPETSSTTEVEILEEAAEPVPSAQPVPSNGYEPQRLRAADQEILFLD